MNKYCMHNTGKLNSGGGGYQQDCEMSFLLLKKSCKEMHPFNDLKYLELRMILSPIKL